MSAAPCILHGAAAIHACPPLTVIFTKVAPIGRRFLLGKALAKPVEIRDNRSELLFEIFFKYVFYYLKSTGSEKWIRTIDLPGMNRML